ncbi:MAG: type II toxin-antitoxin system RelE/ParE family toxin [Mogibacterium sp.]|nr:type II toxin-antitoxin system RelE/ParE family toxin [Mogibacterium sp.]
MNCKIYYSPEYQADLDGIWEYIALQLFNPTAAKRFMEGIMQSTEILREHPEAGAKWYLPGGQYSGYRYVLFEQYISFYQYVDGAVYVARVFHTRQHYIETLIPR